MSMITNLLVFYKLMIIDIKQLQHIFLIGIYCSLSLPVPAVAAGLKPLTLGCWGCPAIVLIPQAIIPWLVNKPVDYIWHIIGAAGSHPSWVESPPWVESTPFWVESTP